MTSPSHWLPRPTTVSRLSAHCCYVTKAEQRCLSNQLAVITQTTSRYQIMHSGGQRLQTVSTAVHGRAVSDFVQEAQQRINKGVTLPKGTYVLFAGEEQARAQSQQDLLVYTEVSHHRDRPPAIPRCSKACAHWS